MKKILFAAVSALAISAAIAADSTQFGVLKVPSSAKQTIVAVPWLESGTGSDAVADAVKVSDLVLTAGLSNGDELRLYDGGSWTKAWRLTDGKWVGAQVAVKGGTTDSGDDSTRIERGKAIMLIRENPKGEFYIMGKPASGSGSMSLPSGSLQSPVYALVAPPTTVESDVNSFTWTGLVAGNDQLIPSPGVTLTWLGTASKWSGSVQMRTVPAGMGMWFVSRGAGTKTVKW